MKFIRFSVVVCVFLLILTLFACRGDVVGSASFERPTEEMLNQSGKNTLEINNMVFKASGNDYTDTGLDYKTEAIDLEEGTVLYCAKPVFASEENTKAFEDFLSSALAELKEASKDIRMDFQIEKALDYVKISLDFEVFGDEGWEFAKSSHTYWWPEKSSFVTFKGLIEYDRYKTFLGDFLKENLENADAAKVDEFLETANFEITLISEDGVSVKAVSGALIADKEAVITVPWEYLNGKIVDIIERAWAQYTPKAEGEKVVAITFDDGPSYSNTMQILDVLEKYQAKATFFCAGHRIAGMNSTKAETVLNRVLYLGSQIGNHSYSHANFNLLSWEEIEDEINKTQEWVYKYTGTYPTVMRPPYGNFKKELIGNTELFCILWNRDILDWQDRDTAIVTQRVLEQAKSGDIILLHDIHKTTADAVEAIVTGLQEKGFRLVTIEELFDLRNQEPNDLKYFAYNYTR